MKLFTPLNKSAFKELFLLLALIVLTRFSQGAGVFLVVAWGLAAALRQNVGRAFACYCTITLFVLLNPFILPSKSGLFAWGARGGSLVLGLAVILGGVRRRGIYRLPFAMLWLYLLVAVVSSATGWYPMISYMKIFQFSIFLLSIVIGTQNVYQDMAGILRLRAYFLGLALFIVGGSFLLWPFPQWSTLGAVVMNRDTQGDSAAILEMVSGDMYLNQALLCGVLYQSQALAAVGSCMLAWLICDMMFCEKRLEPLRAVLIVLTVFVMFLTRSRTALLACGVAVLLVSFYVMPRVRLPMKVRRWVRQALFGGLVLMLVVGLVAEFKSDAISRWVRKTDSTTSDNRSVSEAFTESRMGLVEKSMRDYRMNPLLGMGFQVEERHRYYIKGAEKGGVVLSASIEKGVLPVMVLGETGIVGSVVFALFLIVFYMTCARKRMYVSAMMLTVFVATNMGEATFFSPGGPGGLGWMIAAVGGFVLDMFLVKDANDRGRYDALMKSCPGGVGF